jgi:uroporphyrinogen decarboxylase
MTEKERIRRCIGFKETDAVPWQIDCTTELARVIMEGRGMVEGRLFLRGRNVLKYHNLYEYFGNHLCYMRSEPVDGYTEVEPGICRDEWGVLWDRRIDRDIGNPVNVPLEKGNLDTLQIPNPRAASRFTHFGPIIEANPGRYVVVKISRCLFERAWSLRGMENLLIDLKENPSFVHELFEAITGFGLALIDSLGEYAVDGVRFSDDWGGQLGMLMGPDTWRAFIKPYAARLYRRAREGGYSVFIHSCGNVAPILDDLVEIGVNVFNPLQPETMDVETILARYAGRLAFYGGLSIQQTLPFGSAEEVREEVAGRLSLARRYGGYLIAPAHDMPPDVPPQNVQAMLEVLRAQ